MPQIDQSTLRPFVREVLCAAGLTSDEAGVVADCLVLANLRGVDSHGVLRLIQYSEALRAGDINPRPEVRVAKRTSATALVDADGGYGFRPCVLAADLAVELARSQDVALVGVRNSHHFGMAATYVLRAAENEVIGLLTTTTYPVLPAPGGTAPVVGNNPITAAIPRRGHPPIVLDMALSQVAFGQIRLAAHEGRSIPPGWAFDARGQPTTDATEALSAGLLAPIGGYKGYGLSVIGEVLAGVLTGSPFGRDADAHGRPQGGVGHLLLSVAPTVFGDAEDFYDGVERLVSQIRAAPRAPGVDEVFLPGEIEERTYRERSVDGVPISEELWDQLGSLAMSLGVALPESP